MSLDSQLQRLWYGPAWRSVGLWPLSLLFALVAWLRRSLYRCGVLKAIQVSVPVIVVGNLTVGGTGKTPLVIWLAKALAAQGKRVGIITRGYGGTSSQWPCQVSADSDAAVVGDEAVLLAQQTHAIVCAGPDRVAAAQLAIAQGAQLILSDDGLQHYRLQRDVEWVVIDAQRGLGNGWWLPAGPLREGPARLAQVQAILLNDRGGAAVPLTLPEGVPVWRYQLQLGAVRSFDGRATPLSAFAGKTVHVVTGIGHPQGFIRALQAAGIQVIAHVLPDHARFTLDDITFADALPVLMTGKDTVKCRAFADSRHAYVEAELNMPADAAQALLDLVLRQPR